MKRREILKYTALMTGAVVSAPLYTSILSGCTASKETIDEFQPRFFNQTDFNLVHDLVDVILPKSDSPSASEVGVDQTIDTILANVYKEEDQVAYRSGFNSLIEFLTSEGYESLNDDEKLAVLKRLQDESSTEASRAFLELRQQTISFYLTSEEIGEKYLNYLPVPGAYEPCIDLSSVGGKIWSI